MNLPEKGKKLLFSKTGNRKIKGEQPKWKCYCLSCKKGGVGKTTSAAALASVLTQVHHKRVLLVSMDPQRNLDMICGAPIQRGSEQPSMYDVLRGDRRLEEVLVPTPIGMLAPASNLMYQWTGTPLLSLEEYAACGTIPGRSLPSCRHGMRR